MTMKPQFEDFHFTDLSINLDVAELFSPGEFQDATNAPSLGILPSHVKVKYELINPTTAFRLLPMSDNAASSLLGNTSFSHGSPKTPNHTTITHASRHPLDTNAFLYNADMHYSDMPV